MVVSRPQLQLAARAKMIRHRCRPRGRTRNKAHVADERADNLYSNNAVHLAALNPVIFVSVVASARPTVYNDG